jgi:hypothetical protein
MAYLRAADELHHFVAPTAKRQNKRGFFGRMFDAMVEGRRHSAEREIAAFLEGNGRFLTDDAEREIERILSSSTRL